MGIIKQYYNEAGQIVSKSPDLTTREFYRDVMCGHKFNEMFVALPKKESIGYYKNDNSIVVVFGAGEDCQPATFPGDKDYALVVDNEAVKSVSALAREAHSGYSVGGYVQADVEVPFVCSYGIEMGFIFRSPVGVLGPDVNVEIIDISLNSEEQNTTIDARLTLSPEGISSGGIADLNYNLSSDFGDISASMYNIWHTYENGQYISKVPGLFTDGSKNLIEFKLIEGSLNFSLNGSCILTKEYSFNFLPMLNNTKIKYSSTIVGAWTSYSDVVRQQTRTSLYQTFLKIL
ncbi:hypothetical protein K9F62_03030 [Desulfovibrio sp. JY]|nr:hypothetical protein K9F62_03030 [Desulfovibrio sp. JY]